MKVLWRCIPVAIALATSTPLPGSPMSDAEAEIRAGHYESALAKVKPAAIAGDPAAQYLLAALYINGNGVPKDIDAATTWLERSAAQGYARAQADLGASYLEGRYQARDTTRARDLLEKAAQQGEPGGLYNLGVMYRDGLGTSPDLGKAERYFLAAAEKGHALAQYGVARLAYDRNDFATAARWYQKAADQGDQEAAYNLGYLYHEGLGVPRDYAKANALFLRAAQLARYDKQRRGYKATDMLGNSYRDALGVERDLVEAYKWYLLAAVQGHPAARSQAQALVPYLTREQIAEARRRAEEFAAGK